jgi:hypothetical protein
MRCANARRSGLRPAGSSDLPHQLPLVFGVTSPRPPVGTDGRPAGGVGAGGGGGGGSRWSAEPRGRIGGTDRRSESARAVVGDEAEAGDETMREEELVVERQERVRGAY